MVHASLSNVFILELELEWFIFHRKLMHLHLRKVILSFSSQ